MKYRIKYNKHDNYFYVQQKRWLFWHNIGTYITYNSIFKIATFQTEQKAIDYIKLRLSASKEKEYTTKGKIFTIKDIN